MQEHTDLSSTRVAGLALVALMLVIAIGTIPSVGFAKVFTVNTLIDDPGSEGAGTQSFRWALNAANDEKSGGGDTINVIEFALDDFELADDPVEADRDFVIQVELSLDPNAIIFIDTELEIRPGTLGDGYFFDIVRTDDDGPGAFFITSEKLTLSDSDLRSQGLIGHRGLDEATGEPIETGETIDLVYAIHGFEHDILGTIQEAYFENPPGDKVRLVKVGLGELALLSEIVNEAAYTGSTLLVDGVLRTDTRSLQGDIQICDDGLDIDDIYGSQKCNEAVLIFEMPTVTIASPDPRTIDPPVDGTYAGNITSEGDGRVVKSGVGSLTLTGVNTYTGGTYILQGEVIGDTAAIQGDVHICPGVTSLFKPNDPMNAPSLICDPSTSQLTLDISTESTFAGTLHGQGIVAKTGSGKLIFNSTQQTFEGTVEIDQGELAINTDLGDATLIDVAVTVKSGGTLLGTGTLEGDVTVEAGGTIKGSLDVAKDLQVRGTLDLTSDVMTSGTATLDDNSILAVKISNSPAPGRLDVAGVLTLKAGSIDIAFDVEFASGLSDGDTSRFVVATSQDDVVGELTGVIVGSALFDLFVTYNDDVCGGAPGSKNVCITTVFDPELVDDAVTENQKAVAVVIEDAFACSANPGDPDCMIDTALADDFKSLFGNFSVPSDEIPGILDQLAGEEYSAFADVRSASAARFHRSISRRFDLELVASPSDDSDASESPVGDVSAPGSGPEWNAIGGEERAERSYRDYRNTRKAWRRMGRELEEPMPIARHSGRGGWTAWLDVHGVMGKVERSTNAERIDYRIFGPLFGLDYGVSEHITVGATLGFTRNEINTPGSANDGTGNTYQGGLYVGAVFDKFHLVGSGRYAYSDLENRRRIRFNTVNRSATGDYDARDTSAFFEAAYHMRFADNVIMQPTISVAYNHLDQSSFAENGAVSLNLVIDGQVFDTVQTSVGVRIAMFGRDSERRYVLPQLRLAYEREWLDKNRHMTATLPTAGLNGTFEVAGLSLTRDRAVIGVSSEVGISNRVNLFVDYDLRASKDLMEHSLAFGLRAIW